MIEKKIKELRKNKGYSITELSKRAKVSKSYLSQLERGLQRNPSLEFLKKIAGPLNTTIDYLLSEETVNGFTENDLDKEWRSLIKKAIDAGLQKEEFRLYLNYLKYQEWINKQKM